MYKVCEADVVWFCCSQDRFARYQKCSNDPFRWSFFSEMLSIFKLCSINDCKSMQYGLIDFVFVRVWFTKRCFSQRISIHKQRVIVSTDWGRIKTWGTGEKPRDTRTYNEGLLTGIKNRLSNTKKPLEARNRSVSYVLVHLLRKTWPLATRNDDEVIYF